MNLKDYLAEVTSPNMLLGYKIMNFDPKTGNIVSGADSRVTQNLRLKKGMTISMPHPGIFMSTNQEYIEQYYGGHNDHEVLITFKVDPKVITTGNTTDRENEFTVPSAIVVDFTVLSNLDESIDFVDTDKNDKFDMDPKKLNTSVRPMGRMLAKFDEYELLLSGKTSLWDGESVLIMHSNKVAGIIGLVEKYAQLQGMDKQLIQISTSVISKNYEGKGLMYRAYVALLRAGYNLLSDSSQTAGGQKIWSKVAKTQNIYVYAVSFGGYNFSYNRQHDPRGKKIKFYDVNPNDITDGKITIYQNSSAQEEIEQLEKQLHNFTTIEHNISRDMVGLKKTDPNYKVLADKQLMYNREMKRILADRNKLNKRIKTDDRGGVRLMATTRRQKSEAVTESQRSIEPAYELELIRGRDQDVLRVTTNKTDKWIEIRGKPNYETRGYDENDPLHKFLDKLDPATVAALMAGDRKYLNPNNSRTTPSVYQAQAKWNEPTVAEAIETMQSDKDNKFGVKFDSDPNLGRRIGRIGNLDVIDTPNLGWFLHSTSAGILLWDKKEETVAAVLSKKTDRSSTELHGKTFPISVAVTNTPYEGQGLMLKLYVFLIRRGYALLSDDTQTAGGQKIWTRLARVPGVTVYAVNYIGNNEYEYSAVDPDDLTDANFMVYSDIDTRAHNKVQKEFDMLFQRYDDLRANVAILMHKGQDYTDAQDQVDAMKVELDIVHKEMLAWDEHFDTGSEARLMAVASKKVTTESVQLTELFNQPYTWQWDLDGRNAAVAKFNTTDDGVISVFFQSISPNSPNFETAFKKGDSNKRSGDGDQFRIMTTVIKIIEEFMAKNPHAQSLSFVAKREGAAADDPKLRDSRADLYKRMIQKFATKHDYEFASDKVGRMTQFIIRRREQPVQEGLRPQAIPINPNYNQDRGNLDGIVASIERDIAELGDNLDVLVSSVNWKQLTATQEWLDDMGGGDPVFPDIPEEFWEYPVIARVGREFVVIDGHHRLNQDLKNRRPDATGLIFDIRKKTNESEHVEIRKPHPKDTLGVLRHEMPQVHSSHYPELLKYLRAHGGRIRNREVHARELKAVQSEFSDAGVRRMMSTGGRPSDSVDKKPLIVSRDNYIIDGHHRWLASWNQDETVPIMQVSLPVRQLLQLIRDFPHTTYKAIHEQRTALEQACLEGGHAYDQPLDEIRTIAPLKNDDANYARADVKLKMVTDGKYTKVKDIGDNTIYMSNNLHQSSNSDGYVMMTNRDVTVMIGYLQMRALQSPERSFKAAMAWVNPKYRRQGVASALYDAVLDHGYNLVADMDQTKQSQKVWASLVSRHGGYLLRAGKVAGGMNDRAWQLVYKRNAATDYTILIKGKGATIEVKAVTESLNQPYPYKPYQSGPDYDRFMAELPDKSKLIIGIESLEGPDMAEELFGNGVPESEIPKFLLDKEKLVYSIYFTKNHKLEATGQGDQQRIFATVVDVVRRWFAKEKAEVMVFSASKNNIGISGSRAKLYNRFARLFAAKIGYKMLAFDAGFDAHFMVYDPALAVNENISITGTQRHKQERQKHLVPGSEAWFAHWFSKPLLKRSEVDSLKEEIVNHIKVRKGIRHEKKVRHG